MAAFTLSDTEWTELATAPNHVEAVAGVTRLHFGSTGPTLTNVKITNARFTRTIAV